MGIFYVNVKHIVDLNTHLNLENASASGVKPPDPLDAVFFKSKAEGLEITPFEVLNLENASASRGKPPDPLDMLSFEIQRLKG